MEECVERKIEDFFRRTTFGTNYDAKNPHDLNMICRCCFSNAWKDMARTYPVVDKEIRNNLKIEFFNDLKDQVIDRNFNPRVLILKYADKHGLTLGQSQKVVNMFFKYLYTFIDNPNIDKNSFNSCDCPIDSIILRRISQKQLEYKDLKFHVKDKLIYKDKTYVWSKITDYDAYLQTQELVDSLSDGTRLDFDFNEWA